MPTFLIDCAVRLIESKLLQQREQLRHSGPISADGIEGSGDKEYRQVPAGLFDELSAGRGVSEADQVMVERRAAYEAAVRIVDICAHNAVVAGQPVESGAVRDLREVLVARGEVREIRRLHARAAGELHNVRHLHSAERREGRHVRGAADDGLVRLVVLLDHIARDDRTHAVAEEDQLRAAVIGLSVSQYIDRVRDDEFVAVFVREMPEFLELLIRAVSAMIVEEHVVAVSVQEVRERNVSLVVLRHAVQHDHRALHFFGIRIICVNRGLVLVILCQHYSVDSHKLDPPDNISGI